MLITFFSLLTLTAVIDLKYDRLEWAPQFVVIFYKMTLWLVKVLRRIFGPLIGVSFALIVFGTSIFGNYIVTLFLPMIAVLNRHERWREMMDRAITFWMVIPLVSGLRSWFLSSGWVKKDFLHLSFSYNRQLKIFSSSLNMSTECVCARVAIVSTLIGPQ